MRKVCKFYSQTGHYQLQGTWIRVLHHRPKITVAYTSRFLPSLIRLAVCAREECKQIQHWVMQQPPLSHSLFSRCCHFAYSDNSVARICTAPPKCNICAKVCNEVDPCYGYATRQHFDNRLFIVPRLVRARSTYKDIRIHLFYHTH